MASPFQVATLGSVVGLPYGPQNRVGVLHDGSLLVAANSSAAVCSLYQIKSPGDANPVIGSALSQTFTIASSTALPVDLLCIPGTGVTDIWVVYTSNAGSGTAVNVAHATYDGTTFTWDNTGTLAATPALANSQMATIAWNGKNLIVAFRDGSWLCQAVWTTTKNGSAGWSAAFTLGTTTSAGSHVHPMLLHDAQLAGGVGGTIVLYEIDTISTHADKFAARVLLDSAVSAAVANWGTEVISAITGQNYGAATVAACVDPANGQVHLVTASTVVGAGGVVGVQYQKVSVTSGGVPSFATGVTIDTTSGAGTVACGVDVGSRLYVVFTTGLIGSAGVGKLSTSDAPYTTFSTPIATVANTAGDGLPHLPSKGQGQAFAGYVPMLFQRGTASFTAQYDNTLVAGVLGSSGGRAAKPWDLVRGKLFGYVYTQLVQQRNATYRWRWPVMAPPVAGATNYSQSVTETVGPAADTVTRTVTYARTISETVGPAADTVTTTRAYWLQNGTQTQTGVTVFSTGVNYTETDVWYENASGNGTKWGFLPGYGGSGGVPWYDRQGGVDSIPQTSLATSKADSNFHIYSNVGGVFWASEDPTYTLTELSNAATRRLRAYYDSGTSAADANGFTWRVRTCIWAGEPFLVMLRVDMTNTAGVTTSATDSYEVTALSGLQQTLQGGVIAWQFADGGSGIVGGSQTTPLPTPGTPQNNEPDYLWIKPHSGSGVGRGVVATKKQTLSAFVGATTVVLNSQSNANRIKTYYQADRGTTTPAASRPWYEVLAYRAGLTDAEAGTIGADSKLPDASTIVSNGTPATPFFDNDEFAYVMAASSNSVTFTHTISGSITKRWICHYKLTGYTASTPPLVSLGGTQLSPITDYLAVVDTVAQVAYVKLLKGLVASGAGGTELNNAQLVIGATLGATAYSKNPIETVGAASDTVTRLVTNIRAVAETVGAAADTVTRLAAWGRAPTETIGPAADTVTRQAALSRAPVETVGTATDAISRTTALGRAVAETMGPAADVVTRTAAVIRALAETVGPAADVITRTAAYIRGLTETVGPAADSVTGVKNSGGTSYSRNPIETVGTAADTVTRTAAYIRALTETVGAATDTATRQVARIRGVAETVGAAADVVARVAAYIRGLVETVGPAADVVTDSKNGGATSYTKTITETVGAAADTVIRIYGATRAVTETVGVASDSVAKQMTWARLLAETVTVTDVVARRWQGGRGVLEIVGPAGDVVNPVTGHPVLTLEPFYITGGQNKLAVVGTPPPILRVSGTNTALRVSSGK